MREVHVSGPLRCNSGVALRAAALAKWGWCNCQIMWTGAGARRADAQVLERYTLRAVWAAWPRSRFTPRVSRFLDEVQAALHPPPGLHGRWAKAAP